MKLCPVPKISKNLHRKNKHLGLNGSGYKAIVHFSMNCWSTDVLSFSNAFPDPDRFFQISSD